MKNSKTKNLLFNRFAQAAGPGLYAPSDEGKNGWKHEGEDRWKAEWRRHGTMEGPMDERMKGTMDEWVQGRGEKLIKGSRDEGRNEGSRDEGRNVWKEEGENRYMDVGRKGRTKAWKEGGIDPTSERKGPEQSNIDPRIYKKWVPKIDQNGAKIDPKGSQNEAKTDKKSEQRLQDDLRPLWGAISLLSPRS